jgi:Ran GTPase-activating protein (RanGAP) involved in mRNA processing and transport
VNYCQRIGCNDKTLVDLENGQECFTVACVQLHWTASDLVLLGQALYQNTILKALRLTLMRICVCMTATTKIIMTPSYDGAQLLRQAIAASQLRHLHLNKIMCCELQKVLLQGVAQSNTICRLTISESPIYVAQVVARLLLVVVVPDHYITIPMRSCRLTHLTLTYCNVQDDDVKILFANLATNHSLVSLDLTENLITSVGVGYLCKTWPRDSSLQSLNLSCNRIDSSGATLLFIASMQRDALKSLLLIGNGDIGYQGLEGIGELLPRLTCLQQLEITNCVCPSTSSNKLSCADPSGRDAACEALVRGLRNNTSLLSLAVGSNRLGPIGVQRLIQAVAIHPTLQTLALQMDESVGYAGLELLGLELRHVKLKKLYLGFIVACLPFDNAQWTQLHDKSHWTRIIRAGRALLEGVKHNFHLTQFSLVGLDDVWMTPIEFYLDLNRTCRSLYDDSVTPPALWPLALSSFDRNQKISHLFACLLEQPWLVTTHRNSM